MDCLWISVEIFSPLTDEEARYRKVVPTQGAQLDSHLGLAHFATLTPHILCQ